MWMRYTFEILALALLMAAGSVMSPPAPKSGCRHTPTISYLEGAHDSRS